MSIKDCWGDLDSTRGDGNMENGTTKTNQNEVLKIAEDEAQKVSMETRLSGQESWQKRDYNTNWISWGQRKRRSMSCSGSQVW